MKNKQSLITDFFKSNNYKKIKKIGYSKETGYSKKTKSWHCLSCGINMGPNNPRQLCYKYYCPNEIIE